MPLHHVNDSSSLTCVNLEITFEIDGASTTIWHRCLCNMLLDSKFLLEARLVHEKELCKNINDIFFRTVAERQGGEEAL